MMWYIDYNTNTMFDHNGQVYSLVRDKPLIYFLPKIRHLDSVGVFERIAFAHDFYFEQLSKLYTHGSYQNNP